MVDIIKDVVLTAIDLIDIYLLLIIALRNPFKTKIKCVAYSIVGLSAYTVLSIYLPKHTFLIEIVMMTVVFGTLLGNRKWMIAVVAYGTKLLFDVINREFLIGFTGLTGTEIHNDYRMYIIQSCILPIILLLCANIKGIKEIDLDEQHLNTATLVTVFFTVMVLGAMITFVHVVAIESASEKVLRGGAFILATGGLTITFAMFGAMYFYTKNTILANEMTFNEEMMGQQRKYYAELLDKEEKTKKFRHDIRAHISCIKECIDEEDYTQLKQYVDDMNIKVNEMKSDIQTGNHIINAVVSDIARNYPDVKIIWEGMVSNNLNIKMMDLCIIFSNLLNNACREVQTLEQHREVTVKVGLMEPAIMIQVENYTENNVKIDRDFHVVKNHEYGHGYGLRNVQDSVLSYGGEFEISCKNNMFIVNIVVPNAIK